MGLGFGDAPDKLKENTWMYMKGFSQKKLYTTNVKGFMIDIMLLWRGINE